MPQYSGIWTLSQVNQAIKNLDWTGVPPTVVEYLVVAGGGGGGDLNGGGGGGAGGLLQGFAGITPNTSYFVTVGAGGTASSGNPGNNGSNSVFDATSSGASTGRIVATGGGGGGSGGNSTSGNGKSGGSGGGVGRDYLTSVPGSGISGQGNSSGNGNSSGQGGSGGGGAGTVGLSTFAASPELCTGYGGTGIASNISGVTITYAGGGGGVAYSLETQALGGAGGGGKGANRTLSASAGTPNTGGGGGGGGTAGVWASLAQAGGSGIVVIRYPGNVQYFTGGTLNYSNGFMVHTFYSSGTLAPVAPRLFASPDYQIQRSLRFNSASSTYLSRTPAAAGNRKTWTWSGWVKRSKLSSGNAIFATVNGTAFNYFSFGTSTGDQLQFAYFDGSTDIFNLNTNATSVYRDVSSWYHIILSVDTTQTTAANRVLIYVNGVLQTISGTYPTQNYDTPINNNISTIIGGGTGSYTSYLSNQYITEVNFIDGLALTPASFGYVESTTGVWTPLQYVGTYGTNGFYLNFADNSGITATTLGKDLSGNSNNWTPNNFSVTAGVGNSSLVDTPTNYGVDSGLGGEVRGNYCTMNPLDKGTNITLANGNLQVSSATAWTMVRGNIGMTTGKWYWESYPTTSTSSNNFLYGISKSNANIETGLAFDANGWAYYKDGTKYTNGIPTAYGASWTTGDVIGVAFDADAGTLVFYKNGTSQGTAFSGLTSGPYFPAVSGYTTEVSYINFGQRPFAYTAPTGYKALCTQNLPNPAVMPQTAFAVNALASSGSSRVVGTGIQSDLVWTKRRDAANSNLLHDAVRGAGKTLYVETTSAEVNNGAYYVQAFNSDSYNIGNVDTALNGASGGTYISWTWNAGGVTATNTAGTISAQVRANAQAGFSIVTYTGSGSNGTVGHGLGVAPSFIIYKPRNIVDQWYCYHSALGNTQYILLNSTAASVTSTGPFNNTSPTNAVIQATTWMSATNNIVAYCWAEIAGYSKFGSYVGNASADGPFVYCGFRPAYIMVKRTDTTQDWFIWDKARSGYNMSNYLLFADTSQAEYTGTESQVDLLSNGFKIRAANPPSVGSNASGGTYIYVAFAESPFKYARAR